MVTEIAIEAPAMPEPARHDFGSSARLWCGFLGRAWLWFLGGCLVVTFAPMAFGWRPYVVESGSMQPRINVGDVILASPEHDPGRLLGHVTVFNDPDPSHAGTVKSHRVIRLNPDGTMTTKGDANPTPDPVALPKSDVIGIGRLLVRWIGLPMTWLQRGAWVYLALLLGSVWLAAVFVVRDRDEDDESPNDEDPDDEFADGEWDGLAEPEKAAEPSRRRTTEDFGTAFAVAAREPRSLRRAHHRRRLTPRQRLRKATARLVVVTSGSAALLIPTSQAAFSATTSVVGASWTTAATFGPDYTTDVKSLNPYLYWKLDDAGTTSVAVDYSGNNRNGQYTPAPSGSTQWAMLQTGGLTGQSPNLAVTAAGGANNSTTCVYTNAAAQNPAVNTYSEIIWFKTTSTQGGKLIGFESSQTGVSNSNSGGQYDRHIYMDGTGALSFGAWTGAATTVTSGPGYNDGAWHMAVATMGSAGGMRLYVDDVLVGSRGFVDSQNYDALNGGWWRVGCGNLSGWGGYTTQTNYGFAGSLDEATVYTSELSASNVDKLWIDINPRPVITGLQNGNFETGSISPWTCTTGSGISTNAHSGTYAAVLASNGSKAGECDQTVTLLPNHAYTLTAWSWRATVGVTGGATGSAPPSSNGNKYGQVNFTFTTDSTGVVTVYAQGQAGGTGYVDDITIN